MSVVRPSRSRPRNSLPAFVCCTNLFIGLQVARGRHRRTARPFGAGEEFVRPFREQYAAATPWLASWRPNRTFCSTISTVTPRSFMVRVLSNTTSQVFGS
ncbi:MAG TPA: hypothetical protein VGD71_02330, partial [Kribbella sp.]